MLSYQEIGSAAMLSRACAGLVAGRIVISLPGSEAAVRLAMERLVIPELGHLVQQASR
jgi:molybdenum cofactor biosynthesis protein B